MQPAPRKRNAPAENNSERRTSGACPAGDAKAMDQRQGQSRSHVPMGCGRGMGGTKWGWSSGERKGREQASLRKRRAPFPTHGLDMQTAYLEGYDGGTTPGEYGYIGY